VKKLLMLAAFFFSTCYAQTVEIVVPFPPGGAVDVFARMIQKEIAKETGATVTVANRPGADGLVAARDFLSPGKSPDRILIVSTGTSLFAKLNRTDQSSGIDPIDDFDTIGPIATTNTIVAVHREGRFQNLDEFVSAARKDVINCGVSNAMGTFFANTWAAKQQLKINVVPFKGGADLLNNFMGKHIECVIGPWPDMHPDQSYTNTVRAIATSTKDAHHGANLPLIDLGSYRFYNFQTVSLHKNMNPALRQKITSVVLNLHNQPDFVKPMQERGFFVPRAREGFTQVLQQDYRTLDLIRNTVLK
jgi:tripartite-type tricarboxylate transporter receptor subunit TctC